MIDAALIKHDEYRSAQRYNSWVYEIPSVPIGTTSDDIKLPVEIKEGSIAVVRIACNSTDYDLSIRTRPSVVLPSIDEIYRVEEINKSYNEVCHPSIIFSNAEEPDEQENLYAVIKNDDTVPTGTITIELVISRM